MKKFLFSNLLFLFSFFLLAQDSDQLEILYEKLETLEEEVRNLRNLLEENSILVDRSLELQQQRYLDLDRRILELSKSLSERVITNDQQGYDNPEKETFKKALMLFDDSRYAEALELFSEIIISYPSGVFTPDSYFWSGELFLAQEMYEDAKISFENVINKFSDHQRAPDSLFKLGEIYRLDKDYEMAETFYKRVQEKYPESGAAQLAKKTEENLKQ